MTFYSKKRTFKSIRKFYFMPVFRLYKQKLKVCENVLNILFFLQVHYPVISHFHFFKNVFNQHILKSKFDITQIMNS